MLEKKSKTFGFEASKLDIYADQLRVLEQEIAALSTTGAANILK